MSLLTVQTIVVNSSRIAVSSTALIFASTLLGLLTPDNLPVMGGIAIGMIGLGWSVISAGRDRRIKVHEDHEKLLQILLDQSEADLDECRECRSRMAVEVEQLRVKLAHYRTEQEIQDADRATE